MLTQQQHGYNDNRHREPAEQIDVFVQLFGACHGGPDRKYKVLETKCTPATDHAATSEQAAGVLAQGDPALAAGLRFSVLLVQPIQAVGSAERPQGVSRWLVVTTG